MPTADQLDYLQRSGDKHIAGTNYVENHYGFASYKICDNCIHVLQVYGDGKYWDYFFRQIAIEKGVDCYMFYTRRNPKAFSRRFGAKTVQTIMKVEV